MHVHLPRVGPAFSLSLSLSPAGPNTRTLAPHARSEPPCGAASHARAPDMRWTGSDCLSLPHPPGLMHALAPCARSGPPCVCTPAAGHFACTSTGHALDQLSHCLSLSHLLGLVYAGSHHTRAPGRHHTRAPSRLACTLPPGRFTQTGQHVCMCPERTLGSSSHVRALATRRTSFLSLSLSLFLSPARPDLCAFARAPRAAIDSQWEPGSNNLTFRSKV